MSTKITLTRSLAAVNRMVLERLKVSFVIAIMLFLVATGTADATSIDVSTSNAANWLITGAGASNAPAFDFNVTAISLTSNGNRTGTFVSGGSLVNFNGFWYGDFTFALPSNAFDISLSFSSLVADDRVVLQLNGANIGDYLLSTGGVGGPGVMSFPPGPPDVPFTFTMQNFGTVTSGFLAGQVNTLRLVVNNTNSANPSQTTRTFVGSGDFSWAQLAGTVSYAIPEPSSIVLGCIALCGLLAYGVVHGFSPRFDAGPGGR